MAKPKQQRKPYVILNLGKLFRMAAQEPDRPHGDLVRSCWIFTPSGHMWRSFSRDQARAWACKVLDWRDIHERPDLFVAVTQEEWFALRYVHRLAVEDGDLVAYNKNRDDLKRRVLVPAPQAA